MIIFHEGLPRSGKTWEAMVQMALPAIKKGRHVTTNIKGVDPDKIAKILELPVETVTSLLTLVPWEKSGDIHEYAVNDGLVIFDEVQDFHPTGAKLNPAQIEFITQHGQRGIDIILCGQHMRNIHLFWRDRVQRCIYFKKMSALGMQGRYQWSMNERAGRDKFTEISKGVRKYDAAYFGVYKSHIDGVENKGNFEDDRANILKSKLFTFILPLVLAVSAGAFYFINSIFTGETSIAPAADVKPADSKPVKSAGSIAESVAESVSEPAINEAPGQSIHENVFASPDEYVLSLGKKYRPRMAAFIKGKGRVDGIIEFYDEGYRVRETLRIRDLASFGWEFEDKGGHLLMSRQKDDVTMIVTAWPVTPWGQANVPPADPAGVAPLADSGDVTISPPPDVVAMSKLPPVSPTPRNTLM